MKIEGLISETDYQKEKACLLTEEKQINKGITTNDIASWTQTMEEALHFASKLSLLFDTSKQDPEAQRIILRILGSNLELKDKIARIEGKKRLSSSNKSKNYEKVKSTGSNLRIA